MCVSDASAGTQPLFAWLCPSHGAGSPKTAFPRCSYCLLPRGGLWMPGPGRKLGSMRWRGASLSPWPWGQHLCQWWRALEQSCSGHRARKATAVCTALAQEAASWALNKHPPHFTPSLILWLQFCHHVWNQFTATHPILL